jgi:hypothetical protein
MSIYWKRNSNETYRICFFLFLILSLTAPAAAADAAAPWTQITASAGWSARESPSSVAMPDGSILLMGGEDGSGNFKNDVWRSTDNGVTWTQMTPSAKWAARAYQSSVVMPDSSIILMGGKDGSGNLKNDVWQSTDNGVTWTQMTSNAGWSPRWTHSSVVMPDSSIILMGGRELSGDKNDVWRSTDNGATWNQMTANAGWSARMQHSSVAMSDGSIVLMGGGDSIKGWKNDVWRSTDNGATWNQMTANAGWSARSGHSSVAIPDNSIVLMGGYSGRGFNDVWRSMDNGATWTRLTASAGWSPRWAHSSVVIQDGSIVLMGGYAADKSWKNDVWQFTPAVSSVRNPLIIAPIPTTIQTLPTVSHTSSADSNATLPIIIILAVVLLGGGVYAGYHLKTNQSGNQPQVIAVKEPENGHPPQPAPVSREEIKPKEIKPIPHCPSCGAQLIDPAKPYCPSCLQAVNISKLNKPILVPEEENKPSPDPVPLEHKSKIQEYRRTCQQCGTIWHSLVSRENQISSSSQCSFCLMGTSIGNSGAYGQHQRNKQASESELDRLKKCPKCGSANYVEEIISYNR